MTNNEYLEEVLKAQTMSKESQELKDLQRRRADVEKLLRREFSESSPTIRYGGSMAKGTMIREAYDLDIICYFPHEDDDAGETLKEIYGNVRDALSNEYLVTEKPSALRLKDRNSDTCSVDFHIDVVPGRFTDGTKNDAFIYRTTGEKARLKTNLDVHISHIRDSGVVDAIRLLKLWRFLHRLSIKHFALELLAVEILKPKKSATLATQMKHIWTVFQDESDTVSIEDPANPSGNDLSELLSNTVRWELASQGLVALEAIENSGWSSIFGKVEESSDADKIASLHIAAASSIGRARPWGR
jgi:hypothetical protein